MKIMYKIDDPLYLSLLRRYIWAAIPLSLSIIMANYLWARHETMRVLWLVVIVAIYVGMLFAFHETPQQMIMCLTTSCWMSMLVLGVMVLFNHKETAGSNDDNSLW